MMAPNPHWFAQKPVKYYYNSRVLLYSWMTMAFSVIVLIDPSIHLGHRTWLTYLGLVVCFGKIVIGRPWEFRDHHFEIRFNHLTVMKQDKVVEHEDMRDILTLEPVVSRFNGKLKYHIATFPTGHSIKIYPNLEQHDELIEWLKGYLAQHSG